MRDGWPRVAMTAGTRHLDEGRQHRGVYDYAASICTINSIPWQLRIPVVVGFLQRWETNREELNELVKPIQDRVRRRELQGPVDAQLAALVRAVRT